MTFCHSSHCTKCGKLEGLRGRCKNPDCPASPLFRYQTLPGDITIAEWRAQRLLAMLED